MDEKNIDKIIAATHWVRVAAGCALGLLALFLLVATMNELKGFKYVGSGIQATDTINATGEGTVYAVPDTAQFDVTVQDTASDVATAQSQATSQGNAIVNYLEGQGVASSSIQTTDYEIDPQYSYSQEDCPTIVNPGDGGAVSSGVVYCNPGKQTLTGYQVSETFTVKLTDTSKAGTLLSGVGSLGASQVSGLTFTVSNQDALQAQARDEAIQQAQQNAQQLAKSLGVSLVRVVGFTEGNGVEAPEPLAFNTAAASGASVAPTISTGQNKITDDVTITYEIQ